MVRPSTCHGVGGAGRIDSFVTDGRTAGSERTVAPQGLRTESSGQLRSLREAFERISVTSKLAAIRLGSQSAPASSPNSPAHSDPDSRSISRNTSPSVSRQQSFSFTPPQWRDGSFVSWKPTQAEPRLERTASSPRLPHGDQLTTEKQLESDTISVLELPLITPSTGAADLAKSAPPLRRQPCIVGWAEVENPKETTFPSGQTIYRCTYCNALLKGTKNYVSTWTKVLFCNECKNMQQCNSCHKKAVPFIYTDAFGVCKKVEAIRNFGGLNICGQCVLINPVTDRSKVPELVRRGRKFLQEFFSLRFTEKLLESHCIPEVICCLEALRASEDSQEACTLRVNPEAYATESIVLRKDSSGEVADLPFDIGLVWHMQLCRKNKQGVYGRCETRALTFPSQQKREGHEGRSSSASRTYRIVQRIVMSRGVPESLLYGHLVHELLHAFIWLSLDENSVKIDLAAEEGLCNCILAVALQVRVESLQGRRGKLLDALLRRGVKPKTSPGERDVQGISKAADFLKTVIKLGSRPCTDRHQEDWDIYSGAGEPTSAFLEHHLYQTEYELKVLNRRLSEMEKDSDPAYGVGYRMIRELACSLTVHQLIKILGRHGQTLESFVSATVASKEMLAAGGIESFMFK